MNWKTIAGAPGYEVSDTGSVRNAGTGRTLKPWKHKSGHLYFGCGRKGPRFQVHHAVIGAFGPARPAGALCRHLDDNPENNCIGNLVWGTHQQNADDYVWLNGKFQKAAVTFEVEEQIRAAVKAGGRGCRQGIATQFGITIHVVNHIMARPSRAVKEAA